MSMHHGLMLAFSGVDMKPGFLLTCLTCWHLGNGASILDLGITRFIADIKKSGQRAVGRSDLDWILWDLTASKALLHGPGTQVFLEGNSFASAHASKIALYDATSATLLGSYDLDTLNCGLSLGGGYLWSAGKKNLTILSRDGKITVKRVGDYSAAKIFVDSLNLFATKPGGTEMESFSLVDGTLDSFPFSGSFSSWFQDGKYFLTVIGTVVRVYSRVGAQAGIFDLHYSDHLAGNRGYFWVQKDNDSLRVYRLGGGPDPVKVLPDMVHPSDGKTFRPRNTSQDTVKFVRLDIDSLPVESVAIPDGFFFFGADSSPEWYLGSIDGVVARWRKDRPSIAPIPLNPGRPLALTEAFNDTFAVATASQQIFIFRKEGDSAALLRTLNIPGLKIQDPHSKLLSLSPDGKLLGFTSVNGVFRLSVYSIPQDKIIRKWEFSGGEGTNLTDFDQSQTGSISIQTMEGKNNLGQITINSIRRITDDSLLFRAEGTGLGAPKVSGRGDILVGAGLNTKLYRGGFLINAVEGQMSGWLNDTSFLAAVDRSLGPRDRGRDTTFVYNLEGVKNSTLMLSRGIGYFSKISDTLVFSSARVWNLKTGKEVYVLPGEGGAIGSDHVIFNVTGTPNLVMQRWVTSGASIRPGIIRMASPFGLLVSQGSFTTSFRISMFQPASLTLDILDVRGRRLRCIYHGKLGGGIHVLQWDHGPTSGTAALGPWYYLLRSPGVHLSGKL